MSGEPYYDDAREWRLEMAREKRMAEMRRLDRIDGVPNHLTDEQEQKEQQ